MAGALECGERSPLSFFAFFAAPQARANAKQRKKAAMARCTPKRSREDAHAEQVIAEKNVFLELDIPAIGPALNELGPRGTKQLASIDESEPRQLVLEGQLMPGAGSDRCRHDLVLLLEMRLTAH